MPYIVSMVFRFADEIVDSFHGFDKESLITEFEDEILQSFDRGIV
jgi:hypothetical protein